MTAINTLGSTNYIFPGQSKVYHGKVRDVYTIGEKIIMIASDRISAFDHILPRAIPYKGQVLNQIAAYFLANTKDIVPNWLEACPDPNVAIGKKCQPIKIEMVIRGYLAGHSWRTYNSGIRELCGLTLPEGLKQNDRFITPIITPATKADEGHDEDISATEILKRKLVTENEWSLLCKYTQDLFKRGTEMAASRGLILVDTKYEFGKIGDEIFLIDEIHTPDSSRYFYKDGYEERQNLGQPQKQLSKEFVREWLMDNGFQGKEGQVMPNMPTDFVKLVSDRYIELYEFLVGEKFKKEDVNDIEDRIEKNVLKYLKKKS
jgi:phosphoribosylaminoimidazole-succinocarboxamide synthase